MKKVKVKFVDTYGKQQKYLEKLLGEDIELEYSDEPDYLFYGVFGSGMEHYKYKNCVKIFFA